MCGEADERCAVWRATWVRARKTHECMACNETISATERYHRVNWVHDGTAGTYKHCARCWEVYSILLAEASEDDWLVYVDPYLNCGERYEGTNPRMLELAFVTKAEAQARPELP